MTWLTISGMAAFSGVAQADDAGVETDINGEIRVNLVASRLDDVYVDTLDVEPNVYFNLSRSRVKLTARYTDSLSSRIVVDVRQRFTETDYETLDHDQVAISDAPAGFEVRAMDAYGRWKTDTAGTFTVGAQKQCAGIRCDYDRRFYFGGVSQHPALIRRAGLVPSRVLGVNWSRGLGEIASIDLLVHNTAAWNKEETEPGKDVTGGLDITPVEGLQLRASGVVGGRDRFETVRMVWSGSADYDVGPVRAGAGVFGLSEGVTEGDPIVGLGYHADIAGSIDAGPNRLELLARFESWDPERAVESDRHNGVAVAANLYFDVPNGAVMMGLLYDVGLPEDTDAAITHDAYLQSRFVF